jgi:CubicO group peptidase (beta-lactamase class C family)
VAPAGSALGVAGASRVSQEQAMDVLHHQMAVHAGEHALPAVAYGLVERGELVGAGAVVTAGHPVVDDTTRFRASSITKSVTAATVLMLVERGLLGLQDPVADHLPQAESLSAATPNSPVRIWHLLTMTAGLPTDDPWIDELDDLSDVDFLDQVSAGVVIVRPPGSDYEYSNVGYAVLGSVIAAVTGSDFREVIADEVLAPAGMGHSGFAVPAHDSRLAGHRVVDGETAIMPMDDEIALGAFAASGGLWSSVRDLARWMRALDAGLSGERGPLPASVVRQMAAPRTLVRLDRRRVADEDIAVAHGYGMGLFVSTYSDVGRVIFHQGGSPGFGADLRWHPASRWGVVAMANQGYPSLHHPARRTIQRIVGPQLDVIRRDAALRALLPETIEAMDWAESLLASWDDEAFARLGASTLDRQAPRAGRRDRFEDAARERGPFTRDTSSLRSTSPAHALWRVEGPGGDAWLEVLLTPTAPVRVQHLGLLDHPDEARAI